jgi:integron integrase
MAMVPLIRKAVIDHMRVSSRPSPGNHATRAWLSSKDVRSGETMAQRPKKLLDHVRDALRLKHYSRHTEDAYVTWITRDIFFHDKRHPKEMGAADIEAFLTHLAVQQKVAASTHNQALSALLCLYRDVLRQPLEGPIDAIRARKPKRLPTVLTKAEALQVIGALSGTHALMAKVLDRTGLRLMECLQRRVKDLDVAQRQIIVRDGTGMEDRVTMLPETLISPLQEHLSHVKRFHAQDVAQRVAPVDVPFALARKYPHAGRLWIWPYVFPSDRLSKDPRTGSIRRHHAHESGLQKAVSHAGRAAGLTTRISCHTLRHSFATHLLQQGDDIRTVQARLGHKDVTTTMISTQVLNRGRVAVRSPLD